MAAYNRRDFDAAIEHFDLEIGTIACGWSTSPAG
jgi:hypothetical protein